MKTVESSAVFQPKQWAEKEAGRTIENRTKPELVHNQTSKSNIVRGAREYYGPFRFTTVATVGSDNVIHEQAIRDQIIKAFQSH